MEPFLSSELIKTLGITGIPILAIIGVIVYLFKLLDKRDKIMQMMVDNFNDTIQQHLVSNTTALTLMMKNFEEWRGVSTREHERILNNQMMLLNRQKE